MSGKFNAGKIKKNDIYQVSQCINCRLNVLRHGYQAFTHDIFHFVMKINIILNASA